ncbi:MAG: aminopeptidase P family protein [Gemmatimonadota bacterium]|nr:MAG: aminopeptidase P family protein [Gemmatimonadota bacterium]
MMALVDQIDAQQLRNALKQVDADGWLVYDFHGLNPVAARLIGYKGMVTRRLFLWLPAEGSPVCIAHNIDTNAVSHIATAISFYTTWQQLHSQLEERFAGKRVAMELSAENAVPYLDRVPAGVVELLGKFGTSVVPSSTLVTEFAACWSREELDSHRLAAESIAEIASGTLRSVISEVGSVSEYQVQQRVIEAMTQAGLEIEDPPIVGFGPNAANPHYDPTEESSRTLQADEVVLLDLFGKKDGFAWADQTWMAFSGTKPPPDVVAVWEATRDARDAAVARLRAAHDAGETVTGAVLDDAARAVLRERGYAEWFTHRTGHSIDVALHGSGPHLDNLETNDERVLIPGVVFSVEPGVYLTDRFGVRSEINVVLTENGPEVTPRVPQVDLITL